MNAVRIAKEKYSEILMRVCFFIFKLLLGNHLNDFYEYFPVSLTWTEAVSFCNEKGAALATFYNAEAFNKV